MTGDTHHFDQWLYDDNDLDFSTPEPPGNFTESDSHHGRRSRPGGTDVGSHTRAVIQESSNCVSYTIKWSLVRDGGKLVVQIAFIFKENNQSVSSGRGRRGQSATNGQLNERAAIHNHQDATDEPPIWEQVYDIFECPGAGCDIGPYCFHHQATGVRYPVATKTLTKLVEYAEKGGRLKEHSDVPKHLQNEIISPPTKRKQSDGPQINITNVMPGSEGTPPPKKLRIAGPRDKAIERYRDWHCSQVDDLNWKKEFHAIAKLTLLARLPLNRLFEAQEEEIKFFVSQKIPRGIAH
ncbi:hypothetical protein FGLOB1_5753 [Fusarium globosum]|uniref:Uncharacterized protein n=1 Tax=Fusarium globosum TaxID=78864 RepID=A0A8H6D9Y4_9HYPO|nr:hypothetical protein FGLOB1_5753 [Fusarium globosum]